MLLLSLLLILLIFIVVVLIVLVKFKCGEGTVLKSSKFIPGKSSGSIGAVNVKLLAIKDADA